jgi:hypothetical protein
MKPGPPMNKRSAYRKILEFWQDCSNQSRWRIGLLLLALAMLLWLGFSPKPWVLAEGIEKWRVPDYVKVYAWWAMLINLGVVAGLVLLCPWWADSRSRPPTANARPLAAPRWLWAAVMGAVCFLAFTAGQRLEQSVWDDEEFNLRMSIHGRWKHDPLDDSFVWRPVTWRETLYFYELPNNHVLHSITARGFLDAWRTLTRQPAHAFSEQALRLPAFICGLASVVFIAFFLRAYGFPPSACAIAAWLFALHPWILRYSAEARGYSMAMLLTLASLLVWRKALVHGGWSWWMAWATIQFALLYTIPSSIFMISALNIGGLIWILGSGTSKGGSYNQSGRWFFSNSIAAMGVIQLTLPLMPQALRYFANYFTGEVLPGWPWMRNVLGFFLGGVPWTKTRLEYSLNPEWQPWALANPVLFSLAAGTAALLATGGFLLFLRKGALPGIAASAFLLYPICVFLQGCLKKQFIYEWYLILALPGLVAFIAVALDGASSRLARLLRVRLLAVIIPIVALAGYFALTQSFRAWLIAHPLQAFRESVLVSRGHLPWEAEPSPHIVTMSFSDPPLVYERNHFFLRSAGEMVRRLQEAESRGSVVFLNVGHIPFANIHSPKMSEMMNHPALFELVAQFKGFDPTLDRRVYRLRPGASQTFDFSPYETDER